VAYNDIEDRLDRMDAKICSLEETNKNQATTIRQQDEAIADLNKMVTYLFDKLSLGTLTKDYSTFVERTVH
jgi:hypothetical protein